MLSIDRCRPSRCWRVAALALALSWAAGAQAAESCKGYPLETVRKVKKAGFSKAGLANLKEALADVHSAAFMIVADGDVVLTHGDITKDYNIHSIRKSFLTALIGIAVDAGEIDLDKTMGELGIDDREPLTDEEKTATYRKLIQARSGVYHPAAYETAAMAAARPPRHSHRPGNFWYYDNWDFNVSGRLYEMHTGWPIHIAFAKKIAEPLCMQDYDIGQMRYVYEETTLYPAYPFRMSARDMALFGQLYLQDGIWDGERILPAGWVSESTRAISITGHSGTRSGYGYMWWVTATDETEATEKIPIDSYTANGAGGHRITVLPGLKLVVVNRMDTDVRGGPRLDSARYDEILRLVLAARR